MALDCYGGGSPLAKGVCDFAVWIRDHSGSLLLFRCLSRYRNDIEMLHVRCPLKAFVTCMVRLIVSPHVSVQCVLASCADVA